MRFLRETLLSAADASTNQNSGPIDCSYIISVSLQAVVTGTPVGTLKLQYSNDAGPQSPSSTQIVTNWSDISGATVSISGAGPYAIPKLDVCYQWIRAVFTNSSSTGAVTVNLKSIGF